MSKTFGIEDIMPLIEFGHIHFGENKVQEALDKLMKGRTSLVIAHRLATVRNADKIFVLEKGQIVESGNHDELSQLENGTYKKLSELQFQA